MEEKNSSEVHRFSLVSFALGVSLGSLIIGLSVFLQQADIRVYGLSSPKAVSINGAYAILGLSLILLCIKKGYQPVDTQKMISLSRRIGILSDVLLGMMLVILPARMFVH